MEDGMTVYGSSTRLANSPALSIWIATLLGIVMIAAGAFALGDVMFATLVSVKPIGFAAAVAGAFEVIYGFWTKGWGLLWHVLLGLLYTAFGIILVIMPAVGALILTYILGALLFASGVFRTVLAFIRWRESGWMMLLSGIFGLLAGVLILFGFPMNSIWILGVIVGIDLIAHGIAWLVYAFRPAPRMTARSA
jgi:uncharacterized membrane protein HdeD (DUF308 family)